MATISELLARAAALRDETTINSIDPNRAGGIMYDTLVCLNTLWVASGSSLVISKIYASVAAMQADTAPVSDLTGKALRPGQIVVIASSDADNGSVYRYDGPSSWSAVGKIGNLPVIDSLDSDSATTPLAAHQGKVLDGKISQLGQQVLPLSKVAPENYLLATSNIFLEADTYKCYFIPCEGLSNYSISSVSGVNVIFAFLKTKPTGNEQTAVYATGASRSAIAGEWTLSGNIPSDAAYLYVSKSLSGDNWMPSSVILDGYDYAKGVHIEIKDLKELIRTSIGGISQFKYIDTISNPLANNLAFGLYSINRPATNIPDGYDTTGYGWMLIAHNSFRLLWNQKQKKYWAYLSTIGWYNMSGDSFTFSVGLMNGVTELLQTAVESGAVTLGGTALEVAEAFPKHLIAENGTNTFYDNVLYNVDKYSVIPGTIYRIKASTLYGNLFYAFYNSAGSVILKGPSGVAASPTFDGLVSAPAEASYVLVAYKSDISSGALYTPELLPAIPKKWLGKKWVVVGDSLTEHNSRTLKNYHDYVTETTGISVVNMGLSGSGYMRLSDTNNAFYQRVATIPTDADVITIFGSGNDLGVTPYDLGNPSDTGTSTICGCINTTLDNILTLFLSANKVPVIGVVTPTPWIGNEPSTTTGKMPAYSAAIIECCKRKSIPVLDLYHESNLHPDNASFRALAYSRDEGNGVHPDERGHEIIAPMFENFLQSLLLD